MSNVNAGILDAKANAIAKGTTIEALVTEWCNASEVSVDADGDIWIASPQAGHWLSGERKGEFLAWVAGR